MYVHIPTYIHYHTHTHSLLVHIPITHLYTYTYTRVPISRYFAVARGGADGHSFAFNQLLNDKGPGMMQGGGEYVCGLEYMMQIPIRNHLHTHTHIHFRTSYLYPYHTVIPLYSMYTHTHSHIYNLTPKPIPTPLPILIHKHMHIPTLIPIPIHIHIHNTGCERPCLDQESKVCGCIDSACTGPTPRGEEHNRRWAVYEVLKK